ncbi:MAG: histidinol-phosphate transaminase, partial [Ginsengibacter sp.]
QLKAEVSKIKGVPPKNIFIGNGSDEVIDLTIRIFCEPGMENVIICPPTYGMYGVSAHINNIALKEVLLISNFQLDVESILQQADFKTKLLFICSPNNPTGNNMGRKDVEMLVNNFPGLVIIDEAYINYSRQKSFIAELTEYENLIVMQTLSKAWGLAALRLGLCFASEKIIDLYNKVKPPYNINRASQQLGIEALAGIDKVNSNIQTIVEERSLMSHRLTEFACITKVYPSDANFILVETTHAERLYNYLSAKKIIVRNRNREPLCAECLRITIGTPAENELLLNALKEYGNV